MARQRPVLVQPHMLVDPPALENYVDIEHKMDLLPPFVLTMLIVQIIAFVWSGYTYMMNPNDNLLIEGQFQGWWLNSFSGILRVISSTFLHAGLDHLFGNMALFYLCGVMLEHLFGTRTVAFCYLLALATQAYANYMFYDDKTATVGASGAIFGLVGFLLIFYYRYRKQIFIRHRIVGVVLAFLMGYSLEMGFRSEHVNNAAHMGGLLGGAAFAFFVAPFFVNHPQRPQDRRGVVAVVLTCVILGLGPFFIYQRNLSAHGDMAWPVKMHNLYEFLFQPSGVVTPEIRYRVKTEKRLRDEERDRKEREQEEKDEEAAANNRKNAKGGGANADPGEGEDQSKVCPRCREDSQEPCMCMPGCRWTYLHHFQDSECRIKLKTTIWGPNTGSPFNSGFSTPSCQEAAGRYFTWEPARNNCYAPEDK